MFPFYVYLIFSFPCCSLPLELLYVPSIKLLMCDSHRNMNMGSEWRCAVRYRGAKNRLKIHTKNQVVPIIFFIGFFSGHGKSALIAELMFSLSPPGAHPQTDRVRMEPLSDLMYTQKQDGRHALTMHYRHFLMLGKKKIKFTMICVINLRW